MSGHLSAGTCSRFQRDMDALDTLGPRAVSSAASRDEPLTAAQALSRGDVDWVSMGVSHNYTPLFRDAKQTNCDKAGVAYALRMGFGGRLREARNAQELSGEELGRRLAVSKATISHWENGRYEPNLAQLGALCSALKVSADWLLERPSLDLPADAIEEARIYAALPKEDRRRWRTMRLTMFSTV